MIHQKRKMKIAEKMESSVSTIMTRDMICVAPKTLMSEVAKLFENHDFHHLPVVNKNGMAVGMISRHDYHRVQHHFTHFGWKDADSQNKAFLKTLLAEEVMNKQVICLPEDAGISEALEIFLENKVHSILVETDQKCVGIVTPFDLLKLLKPILGQAQAESRD